MEFEDYSEEEAVALVIAADLIEAGVPVFVAKPARNDDGSWNPDGGTGGCGYHLPKGWQTAEPDITALDEWESGDGLAATGNGACTLIDVDAYAGGDQSLSGLQAAGAWPTTFGEAETISGGKHFVAGPLGLRTSAGHPKGVDVRGGVDGSGVGFIWLAPTRRKNKRGEIRSYRWVSEPDLDALAEYDVENDDGATAFVAAVTDASAGVEPLDDRSGGREYDAFTEAQRRRVDAYVENTLSGLESELREAHSWAEGHRDERGRGWEKLTADAFWKGAKLAAAQWNPVTLADVERRLVAAAPPIDRLDVKFRQQSRRATAAPLPFDPAADRERSDTTLTDRDGNPIVDSSRDDSQSAELERVLQLESKYTDTYLAEHIVAESLSDRFVYVSEIGWHECRSGSWWERCEEAVALRAVNKVLKKIHTREAVRAMRKYGSDPDRLAKVQRSLKPLLTTSKAVQVMRLVKGELAIAADQLDAHPELLNVGNGVVNLATGELLPHDPKYYFTKHTRTPYVPDAEHEDWTAALAAIPDECVDWLKVRYGQGITGFATPDDVMPIQVGGGSNGKSTIAEALMNALGDYAVIVPHRVLMASPGDHPVELMVLRGARFAVMEETPEARHLNATRIKHVLGSKMTARWMRGNPVSWEPTHSLFINTNYVPLVAETDNGTWRRLLLVTFPFRFRKSHEPLETEFDRHGDPGLRERMKAGRGGQHEAVLRWLVDGARTWFDMGAAEMPEPPARVIVDTNHWRYGGDPMTEFVEDTLTLGDRNSWIAARDLYAVYAEYLKERGYAAISEKTFAARFSTHFMVEEANREAAKEAGSAAAQPIRKTRVTATTPGRSTVDGIVWGSAKRTPTKVMAWQGVRFSSAAATINHAAGID